MNPKENLLQVLKKESPDHVPVPGEGFWGGDASFVERPAKSGFDEFGVKWEWGGDVIGTYPVGHPIRNISKLKDYKFPNPSDDKYYRDLKESLKNVDKNKVLTMAGNGFGIFERAYLLMGMDNLLVYMLTNKDEVKWLLHKLADFKIAKSKKLIELGVEAIHYGDDWGTQRSLFMRPDLWRELIKSEQVRLYKVCKDAGVMVFQHSCGHIEEIIPDLIEIGCDCWDPCQPLANDLAKMKLLYGKEINFWGAIDSQYVLPLGTEKEVREEVELRIRQLAPGGGYLPGPSHTVPFPEKNIKAMNDAIIEFGKYPLSI